MIHQTYLISIAVATFFAWSSWVVVVYKLSPFSQPALSLSLFYASLFIAFAGTFTILFYFLRLWSSKNEVQNTQLNNSLRQGILLSFMIVVSLGFQRLRVLTWWDGLLLLAVVLLVEFYFNSRE